MTHKEFHVKELILNGVGFKCFYNNDQKFLCFQLGLSHYIKLNILNDSVLIKAKKNRLVLISSDMQALGDLFKKIQHFRIPDPYKARGIQIKGVKYVLKQGKKR